MSICFFVDFGFVQPSGKEMARGMLPDVSDYAVVQAVSILGAVIMPHNIYLHSALVQSRDVDRKRTSKVKEANFYFSIEAAVARVVNLAVVSAFAKKGFFDKTCAEQGLAKVTGPADDLERHQTFRSRSSPSSFRTHDQLRIQLQPLAIDLNFEFSSELSRARAE